ncbi:hypothetical protein OBBRIDRAFT_736158, partial [Obba rivulosa]
MTSELPPELTDRVIDFLHDDLNALRSCALVCHAWLSASRYHVFRSLVIDD